MQGLRNVKVTGVSRHNSLRLAKLYAAVSGVKSYKYNAVCVCVYVLAKLAQ